jgi:hypothetical protein
LTLSACGDGNEAQSLAIDRAEGMTSFHMEVFSENTGGSWSVDYEAPNTFRIEQTNPSTNGGICYAALPDGSPSPDGAPCLWELVSVEGLGYLRDCSQSCSDWLQTDAAFLAAPLGAFPSTTLPSFPLELLKSLPSPTIDSPNAQTVVISSDFDASEVFFSSERLSFGASTAGGGCSFQFAIPGVGATSGPTSSPFSNCVEDNPHNVGFAVIAVSAEDFTLLRIEATVTDEFGDEDVFTIVFDDIDNTEVDTSDIPSPG